MTAIAALINEAAAGTLGFALILAGLWIRDLRRKLAAARKRADQAEVNAKFDLIVKGLRVGGGE